MRPSALLAAPIDVPPPPKVSHCENAASGAVCQAWLAVVALIANTSTRPSTVRDVVSSASRIPPVPVHADQVVGLVCQRWKTPSALEANTSSLPSRLWLAVTERPPVPKFSQADHPPLTPLW